MPIRFSSLVGQFLSLLLKIEGEENEKDSGLSQNDGRLASLQTACPPSADTYQLALVVYTQKIKKARLVKSLLTLYNQCMEILSQKDKPLYPEILWKRAVYSYGQEAGRLMIIAGSGQENKKALLSAEAAFRTGSGILTLAFPESLEKTMKEFLSKEMLLPLKETPSRSISMKAKEDILAFENINSTSVLGPGLSKNSETLELIWKLFAESKGRLVISDNAVYSLFLGLKILFKEAKSEGIKEYFNRNNIKGAVIITSEDLKKLNFLELGKDEKKAICKLSEILGLEIIFIGKSILLAFESKLIINKEVEINSLDEVISVLSGCTGSLIAQNPTEYFKASVTATYLMTKVLSLKQEGAKESLTTLLGKVIKSES